VVGVDILAAFAVSVIFPDCFSPSFVALKSEDYRSFFPSLFCKSFVIFGVKELKGKKVKSKEGS
jgi:hypothetical protein